nr:hypothetical protein Itr_chr12CG21710 [Ipomoea trifida]
MKQWEMAEMDTIIRPLNGVFGQKKKDFHISFECFGFGFSFPPRRCDGFVRASTFNLQHSWTAVEVWRLHASFYLQPSSTAMEVRQLRSSHDEEKMMHTTS